MTIISEEQLKDFKKYTDFTVLDLIHQIWDHPQSLVTRITNLEDKLEALIEQVKRLTDDAERKRDTPKAQE